MIFRTFGIVRVKFCFALAPQKPPIMRGSPMVTSAMLNARKADFPVPRPASTFEEREPKFRTFFCHGAIYTLCCPSPW